MSFVPVVFDSNIYLDFWVRGRHGEKFEWASRRYIVRQSSVVLHELRRGVRTKKGLKFVGQLVRRAPKVYFPLAKDWWMAAEIMAGLRKQFHWNKAQLAHVQNDTLIACSCRRNGLTLITGNRKDFESIRHHLDFSVIYW